MMSGIICTPQKKKYDLILFDILTGESQPAHAFTSQSLSRVKELLKPGGILLINFQGYYLEDKGMAARSILKTIQAVGMQPYTWLGDPAAFSDVILIGSLGEIDLSKLSKERMLECCPSRWSAHLSELISEPLYAGSLELESARVLDDDLPLLDVLNYEMVKEWREGVLRQR